MDSYGKYSHEQLLEIVRDIDVQLHALQAFTATAIAGLANGIHRDELLDFLKTFDFNRSQPMRLHDGGADIVEATKSLREELATRLTYER